MIATIVLSVLLAVAVIIAIIVIVKDRKKGKCCGARGALITGKTVKGKISIQSLI